TLVEQTGDGIIVIDEEVVQFANRAAAEIIGYSVEELIGKPFISFIASELRESSARRFMSCLTGEYVPFHKTRVISKSGKTRSVGISVSPVRYQGKIVLMAIVHNLSEYRRREDEAQKNRKLESLGIFAAGVAHDFNDLLAVIIGNLSLIQTYAQSGYNFLAILDETQKAAWQAKGLTQQLLTFATLGTLIKKAASLSKLIKDITISTLNGSKTRCKLSLPDELWCSEIDEKQIGQVISNLIINANQAMAGEGLIEISAENLIVKAKDNLPLTEGKYIKVSVKDYGIGIREEDLHKIFDPYFTTKQKGSGLGLAIAYSVIKKHGGHISVESWPGVGTTFHIYLPAIDTCLNCEGCDEGKNPHWPPEENIIHI
ncbi:MAG: ATP-binding protein, partial [Spirochaetota bacterium]